MTPPHRQLWPAGGPPVGLDLHLQTPSGPVVGCHPRLGRVVDGSVFIDGVTTKSFHASTQVSRWA